MKYTVYISNHCIGCDKVLNFLEKEKIDCKIVNVEKDNIIPPVDLLVFPALFLGKRMVAYGEDVIGKFRSGI